MVAWVVALTRRVAWESRNPDQSAPHYFTSAMTESGQGGTQVGKIRIICLANQMLCRFSVFIILSYLVKTVWYLLSQDRSSVNHDSFIVLHPPRLGVSLARHVMGCIRA